MTLSFQRLCSFPQEQILSVFPFRLLPKTNTSRKSCLQQAIEVHAETLISCFVVCQGFQSVLLYLICVIVEQTRSFQIIYYYFQGRHLEVLLFIFTLHFTISRYNVRYRLLIVVLYAVKKFGYYNFILIFWFVSVFCFGSFCSYFAVIFYNTRTTL